MTAATQFHLLPLAGERTLRLTLKHHAFNVFTQPDEDLWTFDRTGRLLGMYVSGVNYRRTLDNRFVRKSREMIEGETYREVSLIPWKEAENLLAQSHHLLEQAQNLPAGFADMARKVLARKMDDLEEEGERFRRIYLPVTILPPDQYMALVLQITEGCNYNLCTFCNFYRDRPFRIKSMPEVEEHITRVLDFFAAGLTLRKSVFLADANALATPQERLVSFLEMIRTKIPQRRVYSFIDVFTGLKKTAEDFARLKTLGLQRVYLGVESGSADLLELLNKPQLTEDVIQLAESLKAGGLDLGLIFLAGAGGKKYHGAHLAESLELVRRLPLGKGDIVYISEFYETNREYNRVLKEVKAPLPERKDVRRMAVEFNREMRTVVPIGTAVSVYDIQQFLY
ncbi:MAG: radical SAM protein [Candidatus Marinimicrobia bacterium]|nr:radical SAM protein [Candidatus Neomarinimicrobiota bacterium]MDP7272455.1 radical SAM protein [Candidatus Neomarinimicrobiota bacterium]|tara:strand:+ start:3309 stop:4496 length:1188 start_codon:yes stop_codon:yes gene_type:complete